MNIVLLASDSKKVLMQNFCTAYSGILSHHTLYSTDTMGSLIEKANLLHVHKFLSGGLGGEKQLVSQIAENEMDMVVFLMDTENPDTPKKHAELITGCNDAMIPLATNLATAEMLILGLERGDLEWRELYKS